MKSKAFWVYGDYVATISNIMKEAIKNIQEQSKDSKREDSEENLFLEAVSNKAYLSTQVP